ncbi:MAG: O-antigen ligase family protein [Endomicrobiia bacterium]
MITFCALESAYGILQYFTGIDLTHKIKISTHRIRGTLGYYNSLGGVLGMMVPFIYSYLIFTNRERIKEKIFFLVSFVLSCIALVLTFTRGAWVGTIISVLVITIYKIKWKAMFLILIFPSMLIFSPVRNRIKDTINSPHGGRENIWKWSIEMISKRPVFGYGFSSFQKLLSEKDSYMGKEHFHSHNVYLNTFVESGIVGVILLLSIMFLVLKYIFKLVKKNKTPLIFGILGVVIDFYLHSFVDNVLWGETLYMFYFFIGILFLLDKNREVNVL